MTRAVRLCIVAACLMFADAPRARLAAAQGGEPQATPRALRVMTYNIKHGQTNAVCTQPPPSIAERQPLPDCNLDLQASVAVIRSHAPDIVGVQEVDRFWARSGMQDQPAALARALEMPHHCYAANLDHQPDAHSTAAHQYGTVILSRFPILECANTLLPRTGTNEQRGLTLAVINVRGVSLRFYTTHLHPTAADRALQTARFAAVIDAAADGPKVLMGDFNARPTAVELQPIQERFADAWQSAGRPTAGNPDGHTSPAHLTGSPASRIDYVYVWRKMKVESALVPIDEATRLAADHYPVVVDLTLPGSEVGVRHREPRRATVNAESSRGGGR